MPNFQSALSTTQPYIPAIRRAHLGRYVGLMCVYESVTALNDAVVIERLNIDAAAGLWIDGEVLVVANEFLAGRICRTWDVAGEHARTLQLRPGLEITLAGDTNAVLFAAGLPDNGTGSDGDVSVDWAGNAYYTKAAGAWSSTGDLYAAGGGGSGIPIPADNDPSGVQIVSDTGSVSLYSTPGDSYIQLNAGGAILIYSGGTDLGGGQGIRLRTSAYGDTTEVSGNLEILTSDAGDISGDIVISVGSAGVTRGNVLMNSLPTSNPSIAGAVWNDSGTLKVSAG